MKKHLNKRFATVLVIAGVALFVGAQLLIFAALFGVYDKAGSDCLEAGTCSLAFEKRAPDIALLVGYFGLGVAVIGAMLMLWLVRRKR